MGGRPVMDYVVERMRAGGATELRVVTRAEKRDVIEHSEELGATVLLAEPRTPSESFAVGLRGLDAEDIVLMGWPDTLWEPADGYRQLVQAIEAGSGVALGLFELTEDLERSDVIAFDDSDRITGIQIKPAEPASNCIWGCAAARAGILEGIQEEEWPGEYFDALCRRGVRLDGVRLSNIWLDVGTRSALGRASAILATVNAA